MKRNQWLKTLGVILLVALVAFLGCKKETPRPDSRQDQVKVAFDNTSAFAPGVKVAAAGEPIDVKIGHLVPCAVDWNNDGKKDLVVGQFDQGSIRLYLNSGTDTEPVFQDSSLLEAGGKPIRLDAG